jgi:hypothetical protein
MVVLSRKLHARAGLSANVTASPLPFRRDWCVAIDRRFCIASSYMLESYSIAKSLSHNLYIVTSVIRRLGNYSGSSWACSR